jgi:hypothetical protein
MLSWICFSIEILLGEDHPKIFVAKLLDQKREQKEEVAK